MIDDKKRCVEILVPTGKVFVSLPATEGNLSYVRELYNNCHPLGSLIPMASLALIRRAGDTHCLHCRARIEFLSFCDSTSTCSQRIPEYLRLNSEYTEIAQRIDGEMKLRIHLPKKTYVSLLINSTSFVFFFYTSSWAFPFIIFTINSIDQMFPNNYPIN